MENNSDLEAGAAAVLLLQIGKREGEIEDEPQESAKKQKTDEVAEEQRNKDEIVSDNSFSDSDPDMGHMDIHDGYNSEESDEATQEEMDALPVMSSENSVEGIEEEDSKTPRDARMLSTMNEQYAGSRTICTKNLSYSVERTDLEDLFKDCGEIVDIRLHLDSEGRFRGFGHIEFASAEAAQKALRLNYTELLRCRMRIRLAPQRHKYTSNRSLHVNPSNSIIQRTEKTQPMKGSEPSLDYEQEAQSKMHSTLEAQKATSETIYVANLSYSAEQTDMEFLFKECGEIVDIRLHTDDKGLFKGYAHVKFATAEAAQKAVELNGTIHLGRCLRVEIAHEKGEYGSNKSNWSKSILKSEISQSTESSKSLQHHDEEIEGKASGFPCESSTRLPTLEEQNGPSKTINVRNLSYSVERADMVYFFGKCGKIVDVRLHMDHKGRFNGFGQVKFATAEAAIKAVELDNTELLQRHIRVDLAEEKGQHAHNRSNWSSMFQNCERDQSPIIYVRGFNRSLPVEEIKASLEKHFGSCGEIVRISIPKCRESGDVKGFAHLEFNHVACVNKALHLDESEFGGYRLTVEKEKPRRENRGIRGGRGGRGGGRREFGGRDGSGYSSKVDWGRSSGRGWHSLHFSDESTGRKNQFQ
ncbi:nucleolin 1-like isoform X2 [Vigna unguiculata]|uniref:nucleolin 1-like isoform X2 n=1 Tax=Vigna unguiculata TaxID=3917 RepID=UPI001016F79E|nr:nucleolin 1-like isoform X2 [Vigna unguiculata]